MAPGRKLRSDVSADHKPWHVNPHDGFAAQKGFMIMSFRKLRRTSLFRAG